MKDSGIEWIGEVPEEWEVELIKRKTLKITDGAHVSPDISKSDYNFISVIDIKNGEIDFNNCLKTSAKSYVEMVKNGCKPNKNDVLLSKDGTIGRSIIVNCDEDFVVASSLVIITPNLNQLNPNYLKYWLESDQNIFQMNQFVRGAALRRISITNINKMVGVFPKLKEQYQIVDSLNKITQQIDDTISEIQKQIIKLQDYHRSLISEVVTGKIMFEPK